MKIANRYLVNPQGKEHGAPSDSERHVGDLGNYKTDGQGNGKGSVEDKFIKLIGQESVIGVSAIELTQLFKGILTDHPAHNRRSRWHR